MHPPATSLSTHPPTIHPPHTSWHRSPGHAASCFQTKTCVLMLVCMKMHIALCEKGASTNIGALYSHLQKTNPPRSYSPPTHPYKHTIVLLGGSPIAWVSRIPPPHPTCSRQGVWWWWVGIIWGSSVRLGWWYGQMTCQNCRQLFLPVSSHSVH